MAKFSKMQVMAAMKETGMVPVFFNKDVEICKNVIKACYEGAYAFSSLLTVVTSLTRFSESW